MKGPTILRPEEFENTAITFHFAFVFDENTVSEIT